MAGRAPAVVDATLPVRAPPFAPSERLARLVSRYTPSCYLDVGTECPMRCTYCCVPRGDDDREVRTESSDALLATLRAAPRVGLKKIALLGGEPTIRGDFFPLLDAAVEAGIEEIILTTKSVRLADASYVKRLADHGVTMVHLSLDAFDPTVLGALIGVPKAASLLLAGLENLLAEPRLETYLYAVLATPNLPHLPAYVREVAARISRLSRTRADVPVILAGLKLHARADRNHAELLPPLKVAADAACAAIALGEELGVLVATRHLPPCLLGERRVNALEAYVRDARVDLATGRELPPERQEWQVKGPPCEGCEHGGWCDGLSKRYADLVGWGEIAAVR